MRTNRIMALLAGVCLLAAWAMSKGPGWWGLAGNAVLSGFLCLAVAVALLSVYGRETTVRGTRPKRFVVAGVLAISALAGMALFSRLMCVRVVVAYAGADNPGVVVLDDTVVVVTGVGPTVKSAAGGPFEQEPLAYSATVGFGDSTWRLNDFSVRSRGWGSVAVAMPGVRMDFRKKRDVVVNGERFALRCGFWDRVSGKAQFIEVESGSAQPRRLQ